METFIAPETPQQQACDCITCSVCWSPLASSSSSEIRELFEDNNAEFSDNSGDNGENYSKIEISGGETDPSNYRSATSTPRTASKKVTRTKCGHIFHEKCLLETKIRKPECPYCRHPLTPILNPAVVATAMENETLQPTTRRDAIIHASIRARNAVLRANARREREREREKENIHSHSPPPQAVA